MQSLPAVPSYMRPTTSRSMKSCRDSPGRRRAISTTSGRVPRHRLVLAEAAVQQHVEETSSMSTAGSSMLEQESSLPFAHKDRTDFILSEASKLHQARPSYFVRSSFSQTCEVNGVSLPTHWHVKQSPAVLQEGIGDVKKGVHLVSLTNDAVGRLESKRKTMQKTRILPDKHLPKIFGISRKSAQFVCAFPEKELPSNRERFFEVLDVLFDGPAYSSDPCI